MGSSVTDFIYKKKLKFDTATIGVATAQANFPVCVHINVSSFPIQSERDNFFATYNVGGKRIQFFDSNETTNLDYEVEYYNSGTPEAIYWVRVPQVDGNSNADYIWVAYGNDPNGTDQDNPTGVWDANFKMVQHMADAASPLVDSTANDWDLAQAGANAPTYQQFVGQVGHAVLYPQSYSEHTRANSDLGSASYTLEIWMYAAPAQDYTTFLWNNAWNGFVMHTAANGTVYAGTNAAQRIATAAGYITSYTWTYLAVKLDSAVGMELFKNGISTHSNANKPTPVYGTLDIGADAASQSIRGYADEVRISTTPRHADWIKLTYYSMLKTNFNGDSWLSWDGAIPKGATIGEFVFKKKLKLDTTASGADVATNQVNFPVCVHINSSSWPIQTERDNFFGVYNANGKRIQFFDANETTKLPYEVELYASGTPEAVYWVGVPEIEGDSSADYIWLAFGNDPNGTDQDNPNGVWDANFKLVHHMANFNVETWKQAEGVYTAGADENYFIQEPSIYYHNDTWKMWLTNNVGNLSYYTSNTGLSWTRQGSASPTALVHLHVHLNDDNDRTDMAGAVADDGGSTTNETTAANNVTANDMTLLPAAPAANDAYYFGGDSNVNSVKINVGTAGVKGNTLYSLQWEYYNGAWVALSGVTDNTSEFTVAGTNSVTYTLPADWTTVAVAAITAYWIRARVVSVVDDQTGYTQPKGTQAWTIYTWWIYGNATNLGPVNLYVSGDEMTFALNVSSVIPKGSAGEWDDYAVYNPYVWKEGADWKMIYEGSPDDAPPNLLGWATSSNGIAWTKQGQITVTGFNIATQGPWVTKIDGTYYLLFGGRPDGEWPAIRNWCDIYLATASGIGGPYSVPGGPYNPLVTRTKVWEGQGRSGEDGPSIGAILDPWVIVTGGNINIYYTAARQWIIDPGDPAFRIGCVRIPGSLADILPNLVGSMRDSTLSNNDPDSHYNAQAIADGVGNARDFYGTYSDLRIPSSPSLNSPTSTLTMESYIYPHSAAQDAAVASKWATAVGAANRQYNLSLGQDVATNKMSFALSQSDGTEKTIAPTTTFLADAWLYLVGVADGANLRMYKDGGEIGTPVAYDGTITTTAKALYIGRLRSDDVVYLYDGIVSEVRVSDMNRSADWIRLTYYSILKTNFNGDNWLSWDGAQGTRLRRPPAYGLDPMFF